MARTLTLREICDALKMEVLCCDQFLDRQVQVAYASDMMSDVLTVTREHSILITGLINQQVVRTAEMIDLTAIVFVRGKRPAPAVVELARQIGIPLLVTKGTMFESCGLLYRLGVGGVYEEAIMDSEND